MSLRTQHNTTVASLQRELDQLRQEHQKSEIQLRELELGNDNLERNERAISPNYRIPRLNIHARWRRGSCSNMNCWIRRTSKQNPNACGTNYEVRRLRAGLQFFKTDPACFRCEEVAILKEKLSQRNSHFSVDSAEESSKPPSTPSTSTHTSGDDLLRTVPPPGIKLSDPTRHRDADDKTPADLLQLLQQCLFTTHPPLSHVHSPWRPSGALARYNTAPHLSPTPKRLKPPTPRPISTRNISVASTSSTASAATTTSRSKGVRMVSGMRAKVRNLEQAHSHSCPKTKSGEHEQGHRSSDSPERYDDQHLWFFHWLLRRSREHNSGGGGDCRIARRKVGGRNCCSELGSGWGALPPPVVDRQQHRSSRMNTVLGKPSRTVKRARRRKDDENCISSSASDESHEVPNSRTKVLF